MTTRPPQAEALLPAEDVVAAQARSDYASMKAAQRAIGTGPVYAGVTATIRKLTAKGKKHAGETATIDAEEMAGAIAALKSLARAIDKATGHNTTGWVANGRDLAPMLEQFRELLALINPSTAGNADPLIAWLEAGDAPKEHSSP